MPIIDEYKTIKNPSTGEFKDKGSKFIAYAYEIESENDFKGHQENLKKEHFKARHHCYAYIIGADNEVYRYNDDGEPGGTAGLPILNQIKSHELSNIGIIVVRYFGGTKLGVPGLINAYKNAAKESLLNAEIITKYIENEIEIDYSFEYTGEIMKLINSWNLKIIDNTFEPNPKFTLKIRLSKSDEFVKTLYSNILKREVNDITGAEIIDGLNIQINA